MDYRDSDKEDTFALYSTAMDQTTLKAKKVKVTSNFQNQSFHQKAGQISNGSEAQTRKRRNPQILIRGCQDHWNLPFKDNNHHH